MKVGDLIELIYTDQAGHCWKVVDLHAISGFTSGECEYVGPIDQTVKPKYDYPIRAVFDVDHVRFLDPLTFLARQAE
jgi:hypothetical protein